MRKIIKQEIQNYSEFASEMSKGKQPALSCTAKRSFSRCNRGCSLSLQPKTYHHKQQTYVREGHTPRKQNTLASEIVAALHFEPVSESHRRRCEKRKSENDQDNM